MANDYAAICARIADDLTRTDLTSQIALEVLTAIQHYSRERFWFNEQISSAMTTTNGQITANSFPTDVMEIDKLEITYSGHLYPLQRETWDWYLLISGDDTNIGRSVPGHFIYYKNQIYLYPVPDATYTLTLSYMQALAALSAGADTNSWMTDGEELIRLRARQAVRINKIRDDAAIQEMAQMGGGFFLSAQEKQAYHSLKHSAIRRLSTGRLTPTSF